MMGLHFVTDLTYGAAVGLLEMKSIRDRHMADIEQLKAGVENKLGNCSLHAP
jgi:hypothetical protein